MIHNWRKATASADNSACVETGWTDKLVGYRDTKQADLPETARPMLVFSTTAAAAFIATIKDETA